MTGVQRFGYSLRREALRLLQSWKPRRHPLNDARGFLFATDVSMGCDIQLGVERRVNGAWKYVEAPKGSGGWFPGRSYKVFARLANVRNDPGEPEVPLAEPRGVPDDLGVKMRGWWDLDQESDFSASWFGLDELAQHDWTGYAWIPEIIELCRAKGPLSEFRIVFWFSS